MVVDLGCGPGSDRLIGRSLAERADSRSGLVSGDDHASRTARGSRLRFQLEDLRDWRPETRVDVIISNATLQWVPGHRDLLPSFVYLARPMDG